MRRRDLETGYFYIETEYADALGYPRPTGYHVARFSGGPLDGQEHAYDSPPDGYVKAPYADPVVAHRCHHESGHCLLDVVVPVIRYHGYRRISANRHGRWIYTYEGLFPKPKPSTPLTGEVIETHLDAAFGRSEATIKLVNVKGTSPAIGQKVTIA